MSYADDWTNKAVPAQLDFLAIYSPDLATSESTECDQIVCYYSRVQRERRRGNIKSSRTRSEQQISNDDEDDRMRQVGLAQGLVNFAKDFSNGEPVDSVDTEKHRIVIKELENGWWIVASVLLTRLPTSRSSSNTSASTFEYSSREVSPPALLLQQLDRAHRIFLLHHGQGLKSLYVRYRREKFCTLLDRYWKGFAKTWDVLLHGNPAVEVYNGIKLAAGGELGIGVGEEDRGSGEREVLEDIVGNTDGLIDCLVFRFGDPSPPKSKTSTELSAHQDEQESGKSTWLGSLDQPRPADGLLFSGTGALSRSSIRDLSDWTRSIYVYGEDAYGVRDNPSSDRRKRRRLLTVGAPTIAKEPVLNPQEHDHERPSEPSILTPKDDTFGKEAQGERDGAQVITTPPVGNIPPPIVSTSDTPVPKATSKGSEKNKDIANDIKQDDPASESNVWMRVLTLGYGTAWGGSRDLPRPMELRGAKEISSDSAAADPRPERLRSPTGSTSPAHGTDGIKSTETPRKVKPQGGKFLIGLKGDLSARLHEDDLSLDADSAEDSSPSTESGHRLTMRTVQVEVSELTEQRKAEASNHKLRRVRILVYVHQPFIFLFLFDLAAPLLTLPSFFYTLYNHLLPLHKLLLQSSSPEKASKRLQATVRQQNSPRNGATSPTRMYDLIYDPHSLTVHCSIPNVPMPGTLAAEGLSPPNTPGDSFTGPHSAAVASQKLWTRVEALTVHAQILSAFTETRREPGERERTVKTSKGWWVAWMRVPAAVGAKSAGGQGRDTNLRDEDEDEDATTDGTLHGAGPDSRPSTGTFRSRNNMSLPGECNKEAVLVRRAGDHASARRSGGVNMGGFGMSMGLGRIMGQGSGGAGSGNGGRLGDMGIDSRGYVERLLSFSR